MSNSSEALGQGCVLVPSEKRYVAISAFRGATSADVKIHKTPVKPEI